MNAPWTGGDLPQGETHLNGVRALLDEILADAHRGRRGPARRDRTASGAHADLPPLHQNATQNLRNKVADHPEDRLHYQAVNLEHMADANEAHRRVEFRDIQAQDGYEQLIEDLRYIGSMLQASGTTSGPTSRPAWHSATPDPARKAPSLPPAPVLPALSPRPLRRDARRGEPSTRL